MSKVRFIGDVHGKWMSYLTLITNPKDVVKKSFQVGDFGVGFGQRKEHTDYVLEEMNYKGEHRFIRGNHDDPAECLNHPNFIKDGTVEDDIMFIGGAVSIDKDWRTPGLDWWEDEELSYQELGYMINKYEEVKPRIMVTHECPESVATHLFSFYKNEIRSRTREAFDTMFQIHKPDYWLFGHWHESRDVNIMGTRFICLKELEYIDLEI